MLASYPRFSFLNEHTAPAVHENTKATGLQCSSADQRSWRHHTRPARPRAWLRHYLGFAGSSLLGRTLIFYQNRFRCPPPRQCSTHISHFHPFKSHFPRNHLHRTCRRIWLYPHNQFTLLIMYVLLLPFNLSQACYYNKNSSLPPRNTTILILVFYTTFIPFKPLEKYIHSCKKHLRLYVLAQKPA